MEKSYSDGRFGKNPPLSSAIRDSRPPPRVFRSKKYVLFKSRHQKLCNNIFMDNFYASVLNIRIIISDNEYPKVLYVITIILDNTSLEGKGEVI